MSKNWPGFAYRALWDGAIKGVIVGLIIVGLLAMWMYHKGGF